MNRNKLVIVLFVLVVVLVGMFIWKPWQSTVSSRGAYDSNSAVGEQSTKPKGSDASAANMPSEECMASQQKSRHPNWNYQGKVLVSVTFQGLNGCRAGFVQFSSSDTQFDHSKYCARFDFELVDGAADVPVNYDATQCKKYSGTDVIGIW
jgi:hypothetical protein